jgi:serine/threonine-protein kinase PknG
VAPVSLPEPSAPAEGPSVTPGVSAATESTNITPPSTRVTGSTRSTRSSSRGNLGAGLVDVPPVPYRDPASVVLTDPQVEERKRFCPTCGKPVGRSRNGQPGRPEGFCVHCQEPYSFIPKLNPSDRVAGQYEVVGCIAHGGLGWVYLARDHNVDARWVVLKGLLNTGDAAAMAAAIAERRFLAQVDHHNIVNILNFVEHEGSGYIVMEYVGGRSLKELRQPAEGPAAPLALDVSIAYMLEILPAFANLHSRGLLYCDFKPDNVIQSEERLKLIDLGGVRRIDDYDSDLYGTVGYQAPEIAVAGASVASDLYTIARTLAVLSFDFRGFQDEKRYATSLPPRSAVPLFEHHESFWWFMTKATDPEPARRFESADEMAEQLMGVLREVIAFGGGSPAPATSALFTSELPADPDEAQWDRLPLPTVDPADPGATTLASLATARPDHLVAALEAAREVARETGPESPEILLGLVRANLEAGDGEAAIALLDQFEAERADWRTDWWRGVAAMARDDDAGAPDHLQAVARELPGELAPKLALAVAHERAGSDDHLAEAARYYDLVSRTDPRYASACFGLARVAVRLGERGVAAEALRRIPVTSSSSAAGQVALCRVLSDADVGNPTLEDLTAASETLDGVTADGVVRASLTRDLLAASLDALRRGDSAPDPSTVIAGSALVEADLRRALEQAYRRMAKLAPSELERVELVDEANRARPRTLV